MRQRVWLDTSVFTTALSNHHGTAACRELLRRIEEGTVVGVLDPMVLGELSYMLGRPGLAAEGKGTRSPDQIATTLLGMLAWPGIEMEDREVAVAALTTWKGAPQGAGFVDCYLQARAKAAGERVCTDNLRHFPGAVHPGDLVGVPRVTAPRRRRDDR